MKRTAHVVTGFVPLPGHPRSVADYETLSAPLRALDVPITIFRQPLEVCWLWEHVEHRQRHELPLAIADAGNPEKNSAAYHIVQHEKTKWLERAAAAHDDASAFVWIDYGTFSQAGVNADSIARFAERAADEDSIALPGSWDSHDPDEWPNSPSWRFLGSTIAIHRSKISHLHAAVMCTTLERLRRGLLDWEVNTWNRIERTGFPSIRWYGADHGSSQHDHYAPPLPPEAS
jgi:hypothetical protein